jgi:hypothetical protein
MRHHEQDQVVGERDAFLTEAPYEAIRRSP